MSRPHRAERSGGSLARNIGFFFFSFVNTACITVFPQHFFAAPQYESRALWLSVTLLAGALCSAAGVHAAGRRGFGRRPVLWGMASCTALALLALVVVGGVIVAPVQFVLSQCALCLGTGYLSQALDERSVAVAGVQGRAGNDAMITASRFLGMLGAPLLFGFALPGTAPAVALVSLGGVCGLFGTWQLTRHTLAPRPSVRAVTTTSAAVRERALAGIAIVIYASYCVLAASAVLLLGDIQGFTDAVTRGPRLIAIVYASAFLGTVLIGLSGRKAQLAWMLPAPLMLLLAALCIEQDLGKAWSMQIGVCTALGLAFALFLLGYRDHVSRGALAQNRPGRIEIFNRMPIVAALVAFFAMLIGAGLADVLQHQFAYLVVGFLALASLVAIAGVFTLARVFSLASPAPQ